MRKGCWADSLRDKEGITMFNIAIDEAKVEKIVVEEVRKKVDRAIITHTLWDLNELSRQVCMSIPFIKDKFFYNEDFPKFKVGAKWLMPAKEAHDYVISWLKQQPRF